MTRPETQEPRRRFRVAIVAHGAHDAGGMERALAELIRRAHREYEIVVVSSELASDLEPLVEWQPIRVPKRPVPLRFILFFFRAGIRLTRIRADLVHTLGALVPNSADLATVQFCHAAYHEMNGADARRAVTPFRRLNTVIARGLALASERWSYGHGRIRTLAAVSRGVARELTAHYPMARVVLAPNGVDLNRFQPDIEARNDVRSAEAISSDELVVLFVGGDWERKGLAIAIEALAHATRSGVDGLRLWVVGRGDQTRFRRLAERTGVAENVRFLGPRSDTERFYAAADVFVLPSSYEAFPLVSLEAAACALPIVATGVNGIEELLGKDDGFVVERTSEAFGEALVTLASDSTRRAEMGKRARRRASGYTWERSTASVLEIYRGLLFPARQAKGRTA